MSNKKERIIDNIEEELNRRDLDSAIECLQRIKNNFPNYENFRLEYCYLDDWDDTQTLCVFASRVLTEEEKKAQRERARKAKEKELIKARTRMEKLQKDIESLQSGELPE